MFLGAGLVLTGCGDEDTATTPAPAPPPPPPPAPEPEPEPEPEPPATPTGLMVSATTETSITWTWNAVEGALAYAVQVSADEIFDDTDATHPTVETTFTASPLPPNTTVYVRVRAGGGDARGADPERLDDPCDGDVGDAASATAGTGGSRVSYGPDGFRSHG